MRGDRGCGIGGSASAAGSGLRGGGVLRGAAGPALPSGVPALPLPGVRAAPARRAAAR